MAWLTLNFGKHEGKSLPQVLFTDPDWFFWAYHEGVFEKRAGLRVEAERIYRRATAIRIPQNREETTLVEYMLYPGTGKFGGFEIVPKSRPAHEGSTPTLRATNIDMSFPCRLANYDKLGCRILVDGLKSLFFPDVKRLTRERCEDFFDSPSHFEHF